MSVRMMAAVWDRRGLKPSERLVLLAFADFADDKGACWPSMASVADMCEMTPRGVRGIVRRLEEMGLISVVHSQGRRSNVYQISGGTRNGVPSSTRNEVLGSEREPGTGFRERGSGLREGNPERGALNPERGAPQPGTAVPPNHQEPPKEPSLTPPPLVPNTAREAESHGGGGIPSGFVSKLIEACEPTAGHWSIAGAANWIQAALDQDWTTDDLLSAAVEGRQSLGEDPMQSLAYLTQILNRKARPAPAPGPAPAQSEGFAARVLAGGV